MAQLVDTPDRMHLPEAERYKLHLEAMEYIVYAHCLNGLVLTVGDNYDCVALWLGPGQSIDGWWTILRSGMWRLQYSLDKEGRERLFNEFLPLLSRSKLEVLGDLEANSWYLNYIGTRASARGKGYARKLIDYVTHQVSIYPLSNASPANCDTRPTREEQPVISRARTTSTYSSMGRWVSS